MYHRPLLACGFSSQREPLFHTHQYTNVDPQAQQKFTISPDYQGKNPGHQHLHLMKLALLKLPRPLLMVDCPELL